MTGTRAGGLSASPAKLLNMYKIVFYRGKSVKYDQGTNISNYIQRPTLRACNIIIECRFDDYLDPTRKDRDQLSL